VIKLKILLIFKKLGYKFSVKLGRLMRNNTLIRALRIIPDMFGKTMFHGIKVDIMDKLFEI